MFAPPSQTVEQGIRIYTFELKKSHRPNDLHVKSLKFKNTNNEEWKISVGYRGTSGEIEWIMENE